MSVSIHIKTEIHQIISTKFSFILKFHYSTSLSRVWLTMAAFWKTSLSKMIGILWVGKPIAWTTALNGEMASNPHTTWKMCLLLRHIKLISFWNNEYICIPTSSARRQNYLAMKENCEMHFARKRFNVWNQALHAHISHHTCPSKRTVLETGGDISFPSPDWIAGPPYSYFDKDSKNVSNWTEIKVQISWLPIQSSSLFSVFV